MRLGILGNATKCLYGDLQTFSGNENMGGTRGNKTEPQMAIFFKVKSNVWQQSPIAISQVFERAALRAYSIRCGDKCGSYSDDELGVTQTHYTVRYSHSNRLWNRINPNDDNADYHHRYLNMDSLTLKRFAVSIFFTAETQTC